MEEKIKKPEPEKTEEKDDTDDDTDIDEEFDEKELNENGQLD